VDDRTSPRELHSSKASVSVILLSTGSLIRTDIGSDATTDVHDESERTNETVAMSPSTTLSRQRNDQPCNREHKTIVSMSVKDTPVRSAKSDSGSEAASGEERSRDRPQYRTSISLLVSSPSAYATTRKLLYRSTWQQQQQQQQGPATVSDETRDCEPFYCHLSPPPQSGSDDGVSRPSNTHDDEENDHVNEDTAPADRRLSSGDSESVKATDNRRSDKLAGNNAVVVKSSEMNLNCVTPSTAVTGRQTPLSTTF